MQLDSAVVLAAGEGTRLRPLTKYRPKPLLPAANRPILEYVLDALVDAGVEDLHVVVGYRRDRVQDHVGATYRGRSVTYHVQEKQLGTGHAVLQARNALDSDFLVVNGDEVVTGEMVEAVIDAHTRSDAATLAVVESDRAPEYGAVRLDGDRVVELVERPDDDSYRLLNAGIYAFGPSMLADIETTERRAGELRLTDTLAERIRGENAVRGVRIGGLWSTATYPWDLLTVARDLLAEGLVDEPERRRGVYVDETASVHDDAVLRPPVVVGPDAVVGPGSVIGPDSALGRHTTVGAGAVVEGSVLDIDTRIGPNATVVDAVTGQGAVVGPGATVPGGEADVRVGSMIHENRRLGCVAADRAHVAGGASVAPGTLLGTGVRVGVGAHASGVVPEGTEVRR
ncbi:sugar phosphate nucleotidyltransferase [Haloplanus halophilus]|uniref:sugar phosphate nucleotidyltransferase n=1 Tax=Haloplanus halophilus TaxID=2949993 RepID=UPI00203BAA2B|nr:sugar phosphate nucleotidyltransferase [Haloplanus sp. GDY1]